MKKILLTLSASLFVVLLVLWWNRGEENPGGSDVASALADLEEPKRIELPKLEYPAAEPATMPKLSLPTGEYLRFVGTLTVNVIPEEGAATAAILRLVKKRPGKELLTCQATSDTVEKAEDGTYPIIMGFEIPESNRGDDDLYLQLSYSFEETVLFEAPVTVP